MFLNDLSSDICAFGDCATSAFRWLLVLWIGSLSLTSKSQLFWGSLPALEPYPFSRCGMKFLNDSECIHIENVLQLVILGETAEPRWKQINIQMCSIVSAGWWHEDLTWLGSCRQSWPLGHVHRANSAGPCRRVARQQERDKSQPVGQQVGWRGS